MSNLKIDDIIRDENISERILFYLSDRDLSNCSLVNTIWRYAVYRVRTKRALKITPELMKTLQKKNVTLEAYLRKSYKHCVDIDVIGHCYDLKSPSPGFYDELTKNSHLTARSLTLRGRGEWKTCRCPKDKTSNGELTPSNNKIESTNFEYIHISGTFKITSCALLDLIARSPKLKTLRFNGVLLDYEHSDNFQSKLFLSNLDTLYWPTPKKRHLNTIKVIVKRNENITCLYTNGNMTCELLSCDILPNLKYLSLFLNEDWVCKPGQFKKIYKYVERTQYFASATKLEGLEIRTFDLTILDEVDQDNENLAPMRELIVKVNHIYEQYKTAFWTNIGKLRNLRYLAVFGSWELDDVCKDISRNSLPIEYLKISLMPSPVLNAIDNGEPNITFSMNDGFKNLKKLVNLRSIEYNCYEKLIDIDSNTILVWKEIYDKIWQMDIKIGFSAGVEDFLCGLQRRGNQLGKNYKLRIIVSPKDEKYCRFILERSMKSLNGPNLKEKILDIANKECYSRYKEKCQDVYLWGVEQIGNTRDSASYEKLCKDWNCFNDKFNQNATLF